MASLLSLDVLKVVYFGALVSTALLVGVATESEIRDTRVLFEKLKTDVPSLPPRPRAPPAPPPLPFNPPNSPPLPPPSEPVKSPPALPPLPTGPSPSLPPWDTRESVTLIQFGYIVSCPLILDVDNDFVIDEHEPSTTSDATGYATATYASSLINGEQRPWVSTTNAFSASICTDAVFGGTLQHGIVKPVARGDMLNAVTTLGNAISQSYNMPFEQAMQVACTRYVQRDHMQSDCTSSAEQGSNQIWDCLGGAEYPNALNLCTSSNTQWFPMRLHDIDPLWRYLEAGLPAIAWTRYLYSFSAIGKVVIAAVACSTTHIQNPNEPAGNAASLSELSYKAFLAIADYVMQNHSMPMATNTTAITWVVNRFFEHLGLDPATEMMSTCPDTVATAAAENVQLATLLQHTGAPVVTSMAGSASTSHTPVDVAPASGNGSWHDRFLLHEHKLMTLCLEYQRVTHGTHVCNVKVGCSDPSNEWFDPHATLQVCKS